VCPSIRSRDHRARGPRPRRVRAARRFQPRRKRALAALAELDPATAPLIARWAGAADRDALAAVEALARHVLGVDAFFAWSTGREAVAL